MSSKKLPSVCIAGYHSCIRAYKFGLALKQAGHKVYWLANLRFPQHISLHVFDGIVAYTLGDNVEMVGPKDMSRYFESFHNAVRLIDKHVDVYHWYNEPDWGVQHIKHVSKKPVLFDLHDLRSDREFVIHEDEEAAFRLADAVLTQGQPYSDIAAERRPDLKEAGLIDHCYPAVNRTLWPDLDYRPVSVGYKKQGGIVYEGGVATGKLGGNEFRFRWWLPFMQELTKLDLPVTIHPSSNADYSLYAQAGVKISSVLPYGPLLQHLAMYDWGLVGNAVKHPAFDKAMPNKLFEYLSAGLPVMVHDSELAAKFVVDNGVGVVVESAQDARDVYHRAPSFTENVLRTREKYCMENEIPKLSNLYTKLVETT